MREKYRSRAPVGRMAVKQRRHLPIALLALTGFVLLWGTTPELLAQQPPACEGPLREESLTQLLKSGVQEDQIKQVIRDCGVDFSLTDEVEQRLRALGASDGVLLAVLLGKRATREEAPKPAERAEPSTTAPARELPEVILERTLAGHTSGVNDIAFSPDGQLLASAANTAKLWEVATGVALGDAYSDKGFAVAFSPDGRWLVSTHSGMTVLRDLTTGLGGQLNFPGDILSEPSGFSPYVVDVAFSPDGRWVALGIMDGKVHLHGVGPAALEFVTLGSAAAAGDAKALARLQEFMQKSGAEWAAEIGGLLLPITLGGHGMGGPSWGIVLMVPKTMFKIKKTVSVAFSPDGQLLASGGKDKIIKLWDVATRRELRTLSGHRGWIRTIAFSPDGRWLASGSDDKTVRLWDVATGRELRVLTGHTHHVRDVAFNPDGRWLASGSEDKTVKLWDVATGREVRTLTGHTDMVNAVAFSPDGHLLASGSGDDTIKLWRLKEQ